MTKHLEKVLRNSKRLGKTGKIACITYTNVAADEIANRLKCDKNRLDISTIHSYLYRNIVKPFSYLIKEKENGVMLFNINELDGHDEHIVQSDRLRRWFATIGQLNSKDYNIYNSRQNKPDVVAELSSLDYAFSGDDVELIIRQNRGARLPKTNRELWVYKEKYWHDGIMHYEDVLYFSYLILTSSPRVVEFIRNKFHYIFVDEFQDTTELQTWIIDKICEVGTKVGVVGDLAQSIYKFTGAQRSDFVAFKDGDTSNYKLDYNHRSTKSIINFLNLLRTDIEQSYEDETEEGQPVCILIGTIQAAKKWCELNNPDESIYILTRKNTSAAEINNQLGVANNDLLKGMYSNDANSSRTKFIHSVLMGYKFHEKKDFRNSLKEILRPLKYSSKNKVLKLALRKIVITIIDELSKQENRDKTILEYYTGLRTRISQEYGFEIGSGFRAGAAKTFYEKHTIDELLSFVKVDTKSNDLIRTIHSTKGAEFENVLIHFEASIDFRKYILDCSNYIDTGEDDSRIYYVGCSRAMARLYINIPDSTQDDLEKIEKMNVTYVEV